MSINNSDDEAELAALSSHNKRLAKMIDEDRSNSVRIGAYMPITIQHDNSLPAIGYAETTDDGRIVMKFNKNSTLTVEQLANINRLAPVYNVLKQDKKGRVLEVELIGFSIL